MKKDTCAPWSSEVWLFETQKCDGGECCDYVLGYGDIQVHFSNDKSNLAPGTRDTVAHQFHLDQFVITFTDFVSESLF
jgi:hypothetical protein